MRTLSEPDEGSRIDSGGSAMEPDHEVLFTQGPWNEHEPDRTHVLPEARETLVVWELGGQ